MFKLCFDNNRELIKLLGIEKYPLNWYAPNSHYALLIKILLNYKYTTWIMGDLYVAE